MSQGHIIPLLHLSRLLCRRSSSTAVTVVSTSGNSAAIRSALAGSGVSILELPFPENVDGVPPGVENTQHLPSMQSLLPFLQSTKLMQPIFEKFLGTLTPSVSCIVSDGFLGWTLDSARKFCIPRYAFFGMGSFSSTMYQVLGRERPHAGTVSLDEPFPMPGFPGLMLTRNDFDPLFGEIDPCGPYVDFMMEQLAAIAASRGIIVNSFYELEGEYIEYWDRRIGPKAHCVGPLCMAVVDGPCFTDEEGKRLAYVEFLDRKLSGGEPVLYVAFGTQAEVSEEQIREIAKGLEDSMVSFLWVLGWREAEFLGGLGFEGRVNGRGLVVKGWVDQFGILRHGGVGGFMSHCGDASAITVQFRSRTIIIIN
ncbi:UDP-Glycosyltransferase superfamily protein [Striga hermonthica]|uniref:UDP-Glycosyltransferase superfamily protein n=1 Tax=Striga hermonthica TaxID=68872 RepID=A0A9N7RD77_STRHE|nr:UDP-Glycosyltransferase superfamily protein [Striga hermonthica]